MRVDELLHTLRLERGSSLDTVVRRAATVSGKSIEVEPIGTREWRTITGLVLLTGDTAKILVRRSDPRWYQFHVVLHELAHVLFGHAGCASLVSSHPARHHVRPGQQVLARSTADTWFEDKIDFFDPESVAEAEAEKLAELLAAHMLAPRHAADEEVFG